MLLMKYFNKIVAIICRKVMSEQLQAAVITKNPAVRLNCCANLRENLISSSEYSLHKLLKALK